MLWQRLQRDMPETLAELIEVAESYALGDPTQPMMMPVEQNRTVYQPNAGAGAQQGGPGFGRPDRPDLRRRRDERPGNNYGSYQVAAVAEQQDAGQGQRQKTGDGQWPKPWERNNAGPSRPVPKKPWQQKPHVTYEAMLDNPCDHHPGPDGRPATHTNRQCSWFIRAQRDARNAGTRPQQQQQQQQIQGGEMLPPPHP